MNSFIEHIFVIISARNRKSITLDCLNRLRQIEKPGFEITTIVVDDGSTDATYDSICGQFPEVIVIKGTGNLWWSGATNLGIEHAIANGADYILTLNDDAEFEPDFLAKMHETAEKKPRSIISGLVCYENRRDIVMSAGRYRAGFLGYKVIALHANTKIESISEELIESELESGYAMLIPSELFRIIGLFDAKRFPHHMGDMDFVLRAREAGYPVIVDTRARLYTNPGKNYLFNVMIERDFLTVAKSLFSIRSNAFWKTRLNFMLLHTEPVILAPVSFTYYMLRMSLLLILKLILPKTIMRFISEKRYGKAAYYNQC